MPVCASCGQETPAGFPRCAHCGALLEALPPTRELRKTVTVISCDVTGSTALGESIDPEALRGLLGRYFERMRAIVESHGGSVEKFIGDAVLAVFGVPATHEDDAIRACRAAAAMRDAFPEVGIQGRIGVNTGEVVTGSGEQRLATGDAVNVAARLEQAAEPGEVLIGQTTLRLARPAVEVGEERRLELKGKSALVPAYPLIAALEAPTRSHTGRFVGRELELQMLVNSWERAVVGPCCELVTIVGDPGVGKSRLVAEFLAGLDARIVSGRCLSYGEGVTYWPVVEVVKQLDVLPGDELAASTIQSLLGENDAAVDTDEIAWAFRKLLEDQAPLVVCFDDIQWGEETFLNLVESVALLSSGAAVLLVCMARPELLDRRPGWPAMLRLEPLQPDEAELLVGDAVPDEVRRRIVRASGGNPLFVTEMLALAGDESDVEVPATLRALLAARLDQLDEHERNVLERGAVEGELFHRGSIQALAPEEREVTPRLAALVRRDLVRPDRAQLPHEDAYRFRHLLIRDAAYEALPKATRADLHRRFAAWLEEDGQGLVELDEILGYHLEQASRYLAELNAPDPALADEAAAHLTTAGQRARWRGDRRAGRGLLERALRLTRPIRLDVHLELDLAAATFPDSASAGLIAEAAADRAEAAGDQLGTLLARTAAGHYRLEVGKCSPDELERLANAALPLLEAANDHRGLARVWEALGYGVANSRGRFEDSAVACEQAIRHARLASPQDTDLYFLGPALVHGPRPAARALEALDSLLPEQPHPADLAAQAILFAMLDRLEEARELAARADERLVELGARAGCAYALAFLALIVGDHETAAQEFQRFCSFLEETGNSGGLSTFAPALGRSLCFLGRHAEAEPLAERGRELGDPEDVSTQAIWRQVRALVLAHRGEHTDAEQLIAEAIEVLKKTDLLWWQGDAYCDLATVLQEAGRRDEVSGALRNALDCYERKEILPLARGVRQRLVELQPA